MKNDYQLLAPDHYTCVPPPGFEIDPAVTEAIREFDPGILPMWRVQLWRFPDGYECRVVHHAIARYFPLPRYLRRKFHVEMPMDARHPTPNVLDAVLEYDETLQFKRGGPGDYVPWDWSLYRWCRFQYDKTTVEAWIKRHERRMARIAKEQADHQEELAYRKKQIEPWLEKKLGDISNREWAEYFAAMNAKAPELRRRPGPMVDLGARGAQIRSPRSERAYGRVAPAQGEAENA